MLVTSGGLKEFMPTKTNAFCNWTFFHEVWCVIIIPNAVHLKKNTSLASDFFPTIWFFLSRSAYKQGHLTLGKLQM